MVTLREEPHVSVSFSLSSRLLITPADHTAASHQPVPSSYSQYETYESPVRTQPVADPSTYSNTGSQYYPHYATEQHDRSYTLGGDSYGANILPPVHENDQSHGSSYFPYPGDGYAEKPSPAPINTDVAAQQTQSPVKGPRSPRSPVYRPADDSPPSYESGPSQPPGAWGAKHPAGY